MHRPLSRVNRIARPKRFGGGGAAAWTPAAISGLTYFPVGPTWCFSDSAGTVPCGVGDGVYTRISGFGPSFTYKQATSGQRPILRQNGAGKYYLEYTSGRYMISVESVTPQANEAFSLGFAFNPINMTGGNFRAYLVMGNGSNTYRSLWKGNDDGFGYITNGTRRKVTLPDGTINQSIICTTATGASVAIYCNGTSLSASGSTSHEADGVARKVRIGDDSVNDIDGAGFWSSWREYGHFIRQGTAALTSDEIAALDTYQRSLYA